MSVCKCLLYGLKILYAFFLLINRTHWFDFELKASSEKFRDFIRKSKDIYYLYDEDKYISSTKSKLGTKWIYFSIWEVMHMTVGALVYCIIEK